LVEYANNKSKIIITCPDHGEFDQRPDHHLQGMGCGTCGINKMSDENINDSSEFFNSCYKIHEGKYEYDYDSYSLIKGSIRIYCNKHGWF